VPIPWQSHFSYTQSTIDKVYYEEETKWTPSERFIVNECQKKINNDVYRGSVTWGSYS
jgi:hypothetical protein